MIMGIRKMMYNFENLTDLAKTDVSKYILESLLGRIVVKTITTIEEEEKKIVFIASMLPSFKRNESKLPKGLTCSACYYHLAEFAYETKQCKLKAFFREKLIESGCDVSTQIYLK